MRTGSPNPDGLAVAYTANGDMEAQAIRATLEAAGIPVRLNSEAAGRLYAVTVDGLGAVRILVPVDRLEEARRIIETPAEPLESDEDIEGDVGEPEGGGPGRAGSDG